MDELNKRPLFNTSEYKKELFSTVFPNHCLHYFAPMELIFKTNQYK